MGRRVSVNQRPLPAFPSISQPPDAPFSGIIAALDLTIPADVAPRRGNLACLYQRVHSNSVCVFGGVGSRHWGSPLLYLELLSPISIPM